MQILTSLNALAKIRSVLTSGMSANGVSVKVKASNQRKQQGAEKDPTLYMFKLADRRVGSPRRWDVWNGTNFDHKESVVTESTFQITGLVTQDETDMNSISASDITRVAAAVLQSDSAMEHLAASGIQVLRVTDVRNPYFVDDRNQFAASPSFDVTICYNETIDFTAPVVEFIEPDLHRI